jgi:hypothetical protein
MLGSPAAARWNTDHLRQLAAKNGSPDEGNGRPKADIPENLAGFCC